MPDFKLRGEEGDESILCELKFISAAMRAYFTMKLGKQLAKIHCK